jgi:hypothetical protein
VHLKPEKMKCHNQNENWSCCLYAWASLLRIGVRELIKTLPQEAQNYIKLYRQADKFEIDLDNGLDMEYFITIAPLFLKCVIIYVIQGLTIDKIKEIIDGEEGVIVLGVRDGRHAVAWNGKTVLDSASGERSLESLYNYSSSFEAFYKLMPIKPTDLQLVKEKQKNAQKSRKKKRKH